MLDSAYRLQAELLFRYTSFKLSPYTLIVDDTNIISRSTDPSGGLIQSLFAIMYQCNISLPIEK